MPNNIKTFEEYRFFKGKKSNYRTVVKPPEGEDSPYWSYEQPHTNIKDENEPFFNRNKWDYFDDMNKKNREEVGTKNIEISMNRACTKMNINREDLENFLKQNNMYVSNVWYNKNNNYWEADLNTKHSNFYSLKYFPSENDYIGDYVDWITIKKPLKKRFDSATEYFAWFNEMERTRDKRQRDKIRKTD